MLPLISIIIPVYNTKPQLLSVCIQSIENQSYQNIEIIVVNDGSEQEPTAFLHEFTKGKPKVKLYDRSNSGASEARNYGTAVSSEEYVMYVDGDDILAEHIVEQWLSRKQLRLWCEIE